ncbi:MAG: HAMP domain-containing sensor histidine kinase [Actinoplanes sp.]
MTDRMVDKSAPEAAFLTPNRTAGPAVAGTEPPRPPAAPEAGVLTKLGHELRSPLAGIIGLTRLMLVNLGTVPPDLTKQRRQLEMTLSAARQSLRTIERVVDTAQIEAGGIACDRHPLDCRNVVAGAAAAGQETAQQRGLLLHTELPDDPMMITADGGILGRVLHELLDNALKFAGSGDVGVCVRTDEDRRVVIEVSDDGPGVPAGDQARIFAAFERGATAAHQDEDGSGLGLYQARKLADLLDARLEVHSRPGTRTAFTITFADPGAPPGTDHGTDPGSRT